VVPGSLPHRAWWRLSDNGRAWLARPWCWLLGYHRPHHCDVYFEMCWVCGALLWSRKRDGTPNPFILPDRSGFAGRSPAAWRLASRARKATA
jgi:hypothetical protein